MLRVPRYTASLLYVLAIPSVSWAFVHLPMYNLPDGSFWAPASLIVGLVFVLRDFAQREVGRRTIFALMLLATVLTFIVAAPELALVITIAFAAGELADWAVFTYTRFRFSTRVLLSSVFAVPVDSIVVLYGLQHLYPGILTLNNFLILCASKFVGAVVVAAIARWRAE